jgi:hypothetical protein
VVSATTKAALHKAVQTEFGQQTLPLRRPHQHARMHSLLECLLTSTRDNLRLIYNFPSVRRSFFAN